MVQNRLDIKIDYKCNYCGSLDQDQKPDKQKGIGFICGECFREKYNGARNKTSWTEGYKKVVKYLSTQDDLCTVNAIHQGTGVHHQMVLKVLELMEFNNDYNRYHLEVKSVKVSNKNDPKKIVGFTHGNE